MIIINKRIVNVAKLNSLKENIKNIIYKIKEWQVKMIKINQV